MRKVNQLFCHTQNILVDKQKTLLTFQSDLRHRDIKCIIDGK